MTKGKQGKLTIPAEPNLEQTRRQELVAGLEAITMLLRRDLEKITPGQEAAARKLLKGDPSHWALGSAVRNWAAALADACRSYSAKCTEIQVALRQEDPAAAAMDTLLHPLADHLGLPRDQRWLFEQWPEDNAVRDFALDVSGAKTEVNFDTNSVIGPLLPRWDRGIDDWPRPQDPFLSDDETREVLNHIEESFRNELIESLFTSLDEAALTIATCRPPEPAENSPRPNTNTPLDNAFIRSATGWVVRYKGIEKAFSDKAGFSMIQLALRNAGTALWPNEVEQLCGTDAAVAAVSTEDRAVMLEASTKQEIGDLSYLKELWKDVQSYEEKIQHAGEGSPEGAMLRREQNEKRSYLSKLTKPGGAFRKLGSDEGKSAKRVNTNVTRAVWEIARHIPQLGEHLRTFLKAGVQVTYLDKSTNWQFK